MARALSVGGAGVLLVDTFPGALDEARRLGLPVLQAELMSEHGEERVSGLRVDYLFAATPDDVYNSLLCTHFAPELGRHRVFQLRPGGEDFDDWAGLSRERRGELLGDAECTFRNFRRRYAKGWRFALSKDQESGLVAVRSGGALAFATKEAGPVSASGEDSMLVFMAPQDDAGAHPQPAPRETATLHA